MEVKVLQKNVQGAVTTAAIPIRTIEVEMDNIIFTAIIVIGSMGLTGGWLMEQPTFPVASQATPSRMMIFLGKQTSGLSRPLATLPCQSCSN